MYFKKILIKGLRFIVKIFNNCLCKSSCCDDSSISTSTSTNNTYTITNNYYRRRSVSAPAKMILEY